jgi:mono/diheme cytochrome c family protein
MMRIAISILGLMIVASAAYADESQIKLVAGPGKDVVERNCSGCHSLDYPQMNSPFLNEKGWDGEVHKMIKVLGAPIPESDVPAIVQYLTAHYGVQK